MPSLFVNPGFQLQAGVPLATVVSKQNYCTSHAGMFIENSADPQDTTAADMNQAFAAMATALAQGDARSIAFFFHGGLVSESSGYTTAQALVGPYGGTHTPAVSQPGHAYPYFFLYETGILTTLQDIAPRVFSWPFFQQLAALIAPSVGRAVPGVHAQLLSYKDGALQGVVPQAQVEAIIRDLQAEVAADPVLNDEFERIAAFENVRAHVAATAAASGSATAVAQLEANVADLSPAQYMDAKARAQVAADVAQGSIGRVRMQSAAAKPVALTFPNTAQTMLAVGAIAERIIERYRNGTQHSPGCTITEEIVRQWFLKDLGWAAWDDMKAEVDLAFGENGVASKAIDLLDETFWSTGVFPRIVLIGHSEGAYFVCKWLQDFERRYAAKYTDVKFDLIFLAAACRTDLFASTLASAGGRIQRFRSFGMNDAKEGSEPLIQIAGSPLSALNPGLALIYPSSLLYYISGVLEHDSAGNSFVDSPLVGMQRYFMGTWPYDTADRSPDVAQVDAFKTGQSVYSPTDPSAPLGRRSQAVKHGVFPTDDETLQSCCYLLATTQWA